MVGWNINNIFIKEKVKRVLIESEIGFKVILLVMVVICVF